MLPNNALNLTKRDGLLLRKASLSALRSSSGCSTDEAAMDVKWRILGETKRGARGARNPRVVARSGVELVAAIKRQPVIAFGRYREEARRRTTE